MITDSILEQLHERRQAYMERFTYNLDAIVRDIRKREQTGTTLLVEPPAERLPTKDGRGGRRHVRS